MLMSSFVFVNVQEVYGQDEHIGEGSGEEVSLHQEEAAWQVVESGPLPQEASQGDGGANESGGGLSGDLGGSMDESEGSTVDVGSQANKSGGSGSDLEDSINESGGSMSDLGGSMNDSGDDSKDDSGKDSDGDLGKLLIESDEDDGEIELSKDVEGLVIGPLSFITSSTSGFVPEVGDVATGAVFISNYRNVGGELHFNVRDFTGDLAGGEVVSPILCLDMTAAPPSNVTSEYRAIVIEVNPILGYVDYQVVITPPGATTGVVGDDGLLLGFQRIGGKVRVYRCFYGGLEIFKYSSNPSLTDGNDLYSIVGAEYGLYNMEDELVRVIVIDENGMGRIDELPVGDYYLKEIISPMGYALDEIIYPVTIVFNEVISVDVFNPPIHNPIGLIVEKYDSETGLNVPSGQASLAGAQFTIRYYDGYYGENPMNQGVNPTRTWVMETDEKGQIYLSEEYKVSGDEFYYTLEGIATLPLGTVTIQESKAPEGYLLNERVIIGQITSKGTEEIVQTFNKQRVRQDIIRGDVEIFKFVEGKGGNIKALEGIYFTFTSHSTGEKFTIVTDKEGYANTKQLGICDRGNLIYDTYTVTEAHHYPQYGIIAPFEVTISSEGQVIHYSIKNDLIETSDVKDEEPETPIIPENPEKPDEPEKPKDPEKPKEPEEKRDNTAPQTGDILSIRLMLQSIVMLISLGIIIVTIKWSRIFCSIN